MTKAPYETNTLEVGVRELRDHLSGWLEQVKGGREVVVTERGRAVARLVPASGKTLLEGLVAQGIVTAPKRPREPAATFGRIRSRGNVTEFALKQRR